MVVFRMQHNELVPNSISKFTSPPCGECLINLLEQAKDILLWCFKCELLIQNKLLRYINILKLNDMFVKKTFKIVIFSGIFKTYKK